MFCQKEEAGRQNCAMIDISQHKGDGSISGLHLDIGIVTGVNNAAAETQEPKTNQKKEKKKRCELC